MRLNLGDALWKPHQSFFNCARSFLVANQSVLKSGTLTPLREAMAEEMHLEENPRGRLQDLFEVFLRYRMPNMRAPVADRYAISRNCRRCALSVFHSPLYDDVPWLISCPIHPDEPLVETCPRCGQAWKSLAIRNPCAICGHTLSLDSLFKHGAFEVSDDYEQLALLRTLLDASNTGNRILSRDRDPPIASCRWEHRLFPSIMAAHHSRYQAALERWHVPLFPCIQLTVTATIKTSKKNALIRRFNSKPRLTESFASAHCKIGEIIKDYCCCDVVATRMPLTLPYRKRCSVCIAHRLWSLRVPPVTLASRASSLKRYYAKRFGDDFPSPPRLYDTVYLSGQGRYVLPMLATALLYKAELWRRFLVVLQGINTLDDGITLKPPFPTKADLTTDYPVGLFLEDSQRLSLVIPAWYLGMGTPIPDIPMFIAPANPFTWVYHYIRGNQEQIQDQAPTDHARSARSTPLTHVSR
jgi:hypothetical protein